jgi:hypothetical protein
MPFIALGPLFSTQSALGDGAEVKDAVGFADIWIPFRLALDFVQRRYAPKADFARSAAALPATSGANSAIGIVHLHRALVHCKPASPLLAQR